MGGPIDTWSMCLNCILQDLFRDTPLDVFGIFGIVHQGVYLVNHVLQVESCCTPRCESSSSCTPSQKGSTPRSKMCTLYIVYSKSKRWCGKWAIREVTRGRRPQPSHLRSCIISIVRRSDDYISIVRFSLVPCWWRSKVDRVTKLRAQWQFTSDFETCNVPKNKLQNIQKFGRFWQLLKR